MLLLAYRRRYQCDLKASFMYPAYIQYKCKLSEQQEASCILLWTISKYLVTVLYIRYCYQWDSICFWLSEQAGVSVFATMSKLIGHIPSFVQHVTRFSFSAITSLPLLLGNKTWHWKLRGHKHLQITTSVVLIKKPWVI